MRFRAQPSLKTANAGINAKRNPTQRTHKTFEKSSCPDFLTTSQLKREFEHWLTDGEIQLHSSQTLQLRKDLFSRLFNFLSDKGFDICSGVELKLFFSELKNLKSGQPLATSTNETFRRAFNAFWRSLVKQEIVSLNAMDAVPVIPKAKKATQQVQPFETEQLKALVKAAQTSSQSKRDLALLYLILDTGLRASEICSIQLKDVAISDRAIRVLGKGDKERTVYFNPLTYRAIRAYLRLRNVDFDEDYQEFLFVSKSGLTAGQPLTRSGVYQTISKLCEAAGITDGKKGPHRGRHSFATEMIRNGAYQDTVQQILGHSDPKMTQRYVTLTGLRPLWCRVR